MDRKSEGDGGRHYGPQHHRFRVNLGRVLYRVLEENKYSEVLRWSSDGKSFVFQKDHPRAKEVLERCFQYYRIDTWHRQLNLNGWTRHLGVYYHDQFYKDMNSENFDAIDRIRRKRQKRTALAVARTTATAPKTKGSLTNTSRKNSTEKTKSKKKSHTTTGKSEAKVASKRKESLQEKRAKRRVREYANLYKLFRQWDIWNLPDRLGEYLENGRVDSSKAPKKRMRSQQTYEVHVNPDTNIVCNQYTREEIDALLICNEEFPESTVERKDEREEMADFMEWLYEDKRERKKLDELEIPVVVLDDKIISTTKPKAKEPSVKWKKVRVGDRIGVLWKAEAKIYDVTVNEQRENTSCFCVRYEDDGAYEWIDLSKHVFVFEEERKKLHQTYRFRSRELIHQKETESNRPLSSTDSIIEHPETIESAVRLPDTHTHLAPHLRFSWKEVGLGKVAGTPAYNNFVRDRDPSATEVTALEILNDIRSLRQKGFGGVLCPDQNEALPNYMQDIEEEITKGNDLDLATKQFNKSLNAVRKVTEMWSVPNLKQCLRTIEREITNLNGREATILQVCKRKGFL